MMFAFVALSHAQDSPIPENYEKMLSEKYKGKSYSPYAKRDFPNRLLWGDSHLHTGFSMDAGAGGCILLPEDAYETNTFIRRLIGEPFVGMLDKHVLETLKGMCEVQEMDQMLSVLEQMQLSPVRQPMRGSLRVTEITGVQL